MGEEKRRRGDIELSASSFLLIFLEKCQKYLNAFRLRNEERYEKGRKLGFEIDISTPVEASTFKRSMPDKTASDIYHIYIAGISLIQS